MPLLSRRAAFCLGAAGLAFARDVTAQPAGPFTLPALPYAAGANEPHIDARTMEIHHDRHHAAYVANLNAAVTTSSDLAAMTLPQLLTRLNQVPDNLRTTIRNNAGGHANHSMFWQVMGGKGGAPSGTLAQAIERDFGSLNGLKQQFNRAGAGVFGSGWVFVTVARDGKLALTTRPNQDTPLMDGTMVLFGNDVWEHAYYLKYQNRRPDYLAAWWNVVDWAKVAERHAAAMDGTLTI